MEDPAIDAALRELEDFLYRFSDPPPVGTPVVERLRRLLGAARDTTNWLEGHAGTDELTQLPNLAALLGELVMATSHSNPVHDGNVYFAMIDLDRFKSVNDTYGHAVGDQALQHIARHLKQARARHQGGSIRFFPGRYGGDEMGVIIWAASDAIAETVLDEVRRDIKSDPLRLSHDVTIPMTISVGIAGGSAGTLGALMNAADKALYEAKNAGRDIVRFKRLEGDRESIEAPTP